MVKLTQLGSDYGVSLGNGSRQALGTLGPKGHGGWGLEGWASAQVKKRALSHWGWTAPGRHELLSLEED